MRKFLFAALAALALCLGAGGVAYAGDNSSHPNTAGGSCTSGGSCDTVVCPRGTLLRADVSRLLTVRVGESAYSCYGTVYRRSGTVVYGGSAACSDTATECTRKVELVRATTASECTCDGATTYTVPRKVAYPSPVVPDDCPALVRVWLRGLYH